MVVRIVNRQESHQDFSHSVPLAALDELLCGHEIETICRQLGHTWRNRQLPPLVTVRSMVYRGLSPDRSISATVAKLVAGGAADGEQLTNSAWCQARSRLPLGLWTQLLSQSAQRLHRRVGSRFLWFGHPVFLVDGSTVSMPDELPLVETFGYANTRHGNSRFPVGRITFITLAGSEAVWDYRLDDYRTDERTQFHTMWDSLPPGCISLMDRKLGSFYILAKSRQRGADAVVPLHQRRDPNKLIQQGHRLGPDQWRVPLDLAEELRKKYNDPSLPQQLGVRLIRVRKRGDGKRGSLWLVTTLMDPVCYPARQVAALYRRRWGIEPRIGSLKTTLEMAVLRSKTAENIRSEVAATIVAHNLVWTLIHQAAEKTDTRADRISFAGTVKTVLAFSAVLRFAEPQRRREIYTQMLKHMARQTNDHPPDRVEPRQVKRDRRRFPFLNVPRDQARQESLS